ncbi:hypothetical protein TNCV_2385371 [Trichonephila clavipes]|nr:hypothetical protein TNCV_2385371 [Trichonephila clavipes]
MASSAKEQKGQVSTPYHIFSKPCNGKFDYLASRILHSRDWDHRHSKAWTNAAYAQGRHQHRLGASSRSHLALRINKIRKTPACFVLLDRLIVSLEEFVAIDDNNVCTAPIAADKDILEFVQIRNIMKSMCSYLEAHSKGEMNNKIDDIAEFDAKKRQ